MTTKPNNQPAGSYRRGRVRAAELSGRDWLNTSGPLSLRGLRGRFVLLDFWTFCCLNCLHVLDELREVEETYADELVVVGVHSPKFAHEADPVALAAAVERYQVTHPVLDDPELITWDAYTARAWPTLVLIDPEGYIVAQYAGEGHAHAIAALLADLVPEHRARGTLQSGDSPYVPPEPIESTLRFPASAVELPDKHLLVADAGHHQIVELTAAGEVVRRFGTGRRGFIDGLTPAFSEPNGLGLMPDGDVLIADTVNHALRRLNLETGEVMTVAGDGHQAMPGDGIVPLRLSSPWDVTWWRGRAWVAMAGNHTLWTWDPETGEAVHVGGTTNEGLRDGPLPDAWFAQPSRLAADGERLWLVDAETSALRVVSGLSGAERVDTAIGQGLFDFGFRDGDRETAMMQHPLGLAVSNGDVLVADTYNGAIRKYEPETGLLHTVASGLAEPSGIVVPRPAKGQTAGPISAVTEAVVTVVESAAHGVVHVELDDQTVIDDEFTTGTQRPQTEVGPTLRLEVGFTPPPGQKVDERFGPASQLVIVATPPSLIRAGDGRSTELVRELEFDPGVGDGVLHIAARAASCDVADGEGAACRMHQQDWGIPIKVVPVDAPGAASRLDLPLAGR